MDRVFVKDLGIHFKVHRERRRHLRKAVLDKLSGRGHYEYIWGLDGVSFGLQDGDILAVIGRNGAGKSTLCLALCGIIQPDRGQLNIQGRVSTLLGLGAGFIKDLTGHDNIYLNGALLGMSKAEIDRKFDEIVEFSELAEFVDSPLRHYSSGMIARLGFSIAVSVEPEVLIIDEVLGVGDEAFRRKSQEKMNDLMKRAKAIIIVTHSLDFARKVCNKALWLHKGKVRGFGPTEGVAGGYEQFLAESTGRKFQMGPAALID